jgi:cytochrome c oxidase subunit II
LWPAPTTTTRGWVDPGMTATYPGGSATTRVCGTTRDGDTRDAVASTRSNYDALAGLYASVGLAVFVLVVLATITALVLGRRRDGAHHPSGRAEAPGLEAGCIALLVAVAAALVVAVFHHQSEVDAATSRPGLRVDVVAAKWRWRFLYPRTGVASDGRLVVPAGRPVAFTARSLDVLHDFWVPDERFQRQVWPDHTERFSLTFAAGTHDGVCAWFCGLRHDAMRFTVVALPPRRFQTWLDQRRRA